MKNLNWELKSAILKPEKKNATVDSRFDKEKKDMFELLQNKHDGVLLFDTYKNEYSLLHWIHNDTYAFDTQLTDYDSLQQLVHPTDLTYVVKGKLEALKLRAKKKNVDVRQCKLMYECNLKDKNGVYKRFHHQYKILELDEAGDIRLVLLLINEIGEYDPEVQARGMAVLNCKTREYDALDIDTCLTKAETQILKLLAKGLDSDKVAKQLKNSKSTINNHRCSILDKLAVANVAQAVNYAHIMEII